MGERGDDQPEIKLGRHRGKFVAVIGDGPGRKRRSLGTADPGLARTRLAEFIRSYRQAARPGRATVGDLMNAYIADRTPEVADPARLEFAAKRLRPTFGNLLPSHIDRKICRSYVATRERAGARIGTAHTELAMLRATLHWAEKQQPPWIDRAPHVWMPAKPAPRDRSLTRSEGDRLVAACRAPHVKLFVEVALATAARAGAILDLTWDRIDLDRRLLALGSPHRAATRKGRATLPINDTLLGALLAARKAALSDYVVEFAGGKVGSVKHGVAAAAVRAGLEGVTPHVLRHSAAVWMAEAGVSMAEIAQFMGHSSTAVTERTYARFSPDYLRRAARALERNSA